MSRPQAVQNTSTVTAVILAGGASSRFGSDKALARLPGQEVTFLGSVVALGLSMCDSVVIVGEPRIVRTQADVCWVRDRWPGEGPLGGVLSGLEEVESERALVLAVDQPFLTGADVRPLFLEALDVHAVYRVGEQLFPMPAVLQVQRCRRDLAPFWETGERSLLSALRQIGVRDVEASAETAARLMDVDRPEDLLVRNDVTEG